MQPVIQGTTYGWYQKVPASGSRGRYVSEPLARGGGLLEHVGAVHGRRHPQPVPVTRGYAACQVRPTSAGQHLC